MSETNEIIIDGSQGEGGGQILRSSLSLSVMLGLPLRIQNIRAKRDKPGLRPQHLTAAKALAALSQADILGDRVGSKELTFTPKTWEGGDHAISIGTAGATALLLHALFYPMSHGNPGGTLLLNGGTHNERAPSFHYLQHVWAPLLRQTGFQIELDLPVVGFYPKGGGQLSANIPGQQTPHPSSWTTRPPLSKITIISMFAHPQNKKKPQHEIAQRMLLSAQKTLQQASLPKIEIESHQLTPHSASIGAFCGVYCQFGALRAGFDAFGWKGRPAEQVGAEAAALACRFMQSKACLDEWAADQMLLPLALANGNSTFTTTKLSGHLNTNAQIIQTFLPHKKISFKQNDLLVDVHIQQQD